MRPAASEEGNHEPSHKRDGRANSSEIISRTPLAANFIRNRYAPFRNTREMNPAQSMNARQGAQYSELTGDCSYDHSRISLEHHYIYYDHRNDSPHRFHHLFCGNRYKLNFPSNQSRCVVTGYVRATWRSPPEFRKMGERPLTGSHSAAVTGWSWPTAPIRDPISSKGRHPASHDCGFNWSMQHLISNFREEDVENATATEDLLQRRSEGDDVGSVATRRIASQYRTPL